MECIARRGFFLVNEYACHQIRFHLRIANLISLGGRAFPLSIHFVNVSWCASKMNHTSVRMRIKTGILKGLPTSREVKGRDTGREIPFLSSQDYPPYIAIYRINRIL
jgi:hypothetical protein